MTAPLPDFPGAVGITALRVYPWEAADGLCGGSPHIHLCCSEGYIVVGGAGRVQTLTASGFTETPLRPGDVVWFTPGTIHRAVNDGDLHVRAYRRASCGHARHVRPFVAIRSRPAGGRGKRPEYCKVTG